MKRPEYANIHRQKVDWWESRARGTGSDCLMGTGCSLGTDGKKGCLHTVDVLNAPALFTIKQFCYVNFKEKVLRVAEMMMVEITLTMGKKW